MKDKDGTIKKVQELLAAKDAVLFCLENPTGLSGMHGLAYWAQVVEDKRKELKGLL